MDAGTAVVRIAMGFASAEGQASLPTATVAIPDPYGKVSRPVIILFHPRAVRPKNRRFPLAILSIAAVLEGREEYAIVDGNLDLHPTETIAALIQLQAGERVA